MRWRNVTVIHYELLFDPNHYSSSWIIGSLQRRACLVWRLKGINAISFRRLTTHVKKATRISPRAVGTLAWGVSPMTDQR